MMGRTAKQNRRYRLHQRVKKLYRYSALEKTIYVPFDQEANEEPVIELKNKFNYSIQTEIQ